MHPEYPKVPARARVGMEHDGMVGWVDPDYRPSIPDADGHGGTVDTPRAMIEVRAEHDYAEEECAMCSSPSPYTSGHKGWHYSPGSWGPEDPPLWRHP